MILKSSRKNTVIFITKFSGIFLILITLFLGVSYGNFIKALIFAIFCALLIFGMMALCMLPIDITADDKYIYIYKFLKKYKVSFNEIKMVELFMNSTGRGIAPVIRVTKNSGERIIQGMGLLNSEKTELLISILNLHNIKIYNTKLD